MMKYRLLYVEGDWYFYEYILNSDPAGEIKVNYKTGEWEIVKKGRDDSTGYWESSFISAMINKYKNNKLKPQGYVAWY